MIYFFTRPDKGFVQCGLCFHQDIDRQVTIMLENNFIMERTGCFRTQHPTFCAVYSIQNWWSKTVNILSTNCKKWCKGRNTQRYWPWPFQRFHILNLFLYANTCKPHQKNESNLNFFFKYLKKITRPKSWRVLEKTSSLIRINCCQSTVQQRIEKKTKKGQKGSCVKYKLGLTAK